MTNAPRDNNQVPTLIVASNDDGNTLVNVKVNPSTHIVQADDNNTGSDLSGDNALRDSNSVPIAIGVSSVDGVTPVPVYGIPSSGKILIKST